MTPSKPDAFEHASASRAIPTDGGVSATPVTVDEVKGLLEQGQPVTFVDARNPIAWGSSKVKLPGAIRVPLEEADTLLPRLPRDRYLIVYCT